jgi:hypothetical protein
MYRETYSCDDILLVPRYSELKSRNECDPGIDVYNLPIISSPMDTVYSKELDKLLTDNKIMTSVHRYFKDYKGQLEAAYSDKSRSCDYRFFAVGSILGGGKKWIDGLFSSGVRHFLVDMAHGDSEACVETVKYLKNKIGDEGKIIAGNVATKSGFRRLEEAGAWGIRVGIGSGCFTPDMKVNTPNGEIKICDLKIGDKVFTHTGKDREIEAVLTYETDVDLVVVNGKIESTENHEYYVLHKKFENIVNEENIHQLAEWIRADNLTENYFLIERESE